MHNTTEIQRELIRLGFLAQGGDDGILGQASLEAYNHFLASKGKPPHVGMLLLAELNADLFPDEQPVPKPKRNTVFGRLLASFLLNQLVKGLPMSEFLSGYRTYIIGAIMALAAIAQLAGIELPKLDSGNAGNLLLEAFAIIFLRSGIKTWK